MELSTYKNKRDFSVTNEPSGRKKRTPDRKRFVIQFHEARRDHYDFRLEFGGVLLSWAVPKRPSYDERRLAVRVEDHPVDYADFEGQIPKGQYGAGSVRIWDKGFYTPKTGFKDGLTKGSLKFTLSGERLKGDWALVRLHDDDKNWLLIKEKDGVKGIECDESPIAKAATNPFSSFETKQAKAVGSVPSGYIYEIKFDGYRISAFCEDGRIRLVSRGGANLSDKYSAVKDALKVLMGRRAAVFDGEAVVVKNGRTDFGALQHAKGDEVSYAIFDLLALDGEDLRQLPLADRKAKLKALLKKASPVLSFSESFFDGNALFEAAKRAGAEGIVCKKSDATYFENDWLKVKTRARQEFVILGYTSGEKEISSLLLGVYNDGKLDYVGKVGTGLNAKNIRLLKEKFAKLASSEPLVKGQKNVNWLKPVLMAEVEFAEWTASGHLRQPSFKGIREDKDAGSVTNEDPSALHGISISSPEKILFNSPQVTKMDVARYYDRVASLMLPFLKNRPVTVVRCNGGIEKKFFKKHPGSDKSSLIYLNSESDILKEVQLGTVEFHMQCFSETAPILVFDLDPDEGLNLAAVRRGALDIKKVLDELGLKSYLKLSGGKGYHILAPMDRMGEKEFTDFAHSIAELLAAKYPDRYTSNMKKERRKGKIFIDWERNSPAATAVAPYSLRAREGATLSIPIPWTKLSSFAPDQFDIFSDFPISKNSFFTP